MEHTVADLVNLHAAQRAATPNLFVINLGPGDHQGFNIDFDGWTGNQLKYHSVQWLSQGFEGVLFKGAGRDLTRIRPIADDNIFVGPHNGIVAFESLTIGCKSVVGKGKAIHMGLANQPVHPKFKCVLKDVKLDAEAPFVWGLFGYQCDWELEDVTFEPTMAQGREHNLYAHGFAQTGAKFTNITMHGCGAECLKFTARPGECRWVPNPVVHIKDSVFKNWYQDWSWRGGAGLVSQASTCHIVIENTLYYGNATNYNKSKCVMIDGNSGGDYNVNDGTIGNGPSTGHVYLKHVGMSGAAGPSWFTPIMRIGNNGGTNPQCALTLTMDQCGVYGMNRQIQIHSGSQDGFKGRGVIQNCNTPQIRDCLFARGMNVDHEAMIDRPGGFIPVSQGIVIPRN